MEASESDRNTTFFRFEDLRIYHKAQDYIKWVHGATRTDAECVHDDLRKQFNKTARSIAVYIAEGSARNKSQFIYYLKMAKSAVRECLVHTTTLYSLEGLDDEQNDISRNYLMEMTKMIGALISSLQRGHGGSRERESHDDYEGGQVEMHSNHDMNENHY